MKKDVFRRAHQHGDVLCVDLLYPRQPDESVRRKRVRKLQIGLMDTRAADDIRVSYDYEGDGWVIEQEQIVIDKDGMFHGAGDWKEVAFVKAWARQEPHKTH